jgi:tetratricopeptide (TPR) repeat protein
VNKYRVKLHNGRIVGPVTAKQVGELFAKGHVDGKENFQVFPAGDWGSLSNFEELKKSLKAQIIDKRETSIRKDSGDNTIARIKIPQKEKPVEKPQPEQREPSKADDGFSEFQFEKKTSTKINYKELEEKYSEIEDDETSEEGIEKTRLIRIPSKQGNIDKTRVVNPKHIFEEEVEEEPEEEVVEEQPVEEQISVDEKTGFVDLKEIMSDIKSIAQVAEEELERAAQKEVPVKEVVEVKPEEKKPVKKDNKRTIIVGVLAILLLVFMFGTDDSSKEKTPKPVYVTYKFPVTKKKANEELSKQQYKKGIEFYLKDNYVSKINASKLFLKSVENKYDGNPALGMLVKTYAELLAEAKDPKKAKNTLFRLIQVSQNKRLKDSDLTLGVAKFYAHLEKFSSAERVIESYLRINKKNLQIFTYYLYILVENGEFVKAKRIYKILEDLKGKTAETYFYMAHYLRANDNFQKQRELLKKAVEIKPNSVKLWLALSDNLFAEGEYALLDKCLDKIKKLNMERSPHYYSKYLEYRGMLKALNGEIDLGVKYLKKALKYKESNALRSKLASLDQVGTESVQILIQESKIRDSMRKAREYQRKKNWEKAFRFAIEAVDLNENYIPSQLLLADIQTQRGYYQAALETTSFLKKEYPANPDVAYSYISALMKVEKMDVANQQISFISNETKFFLLPKFQALLGKYWLKKNNFAFAIQYYQMAIKKDPLNDEYYYILAKEFFKKKRFKDAKQFLSKCLDLDPDNVFYLSLQGAILYELEDADTAIGYLRDVLKEFPDHPKLLGDIAMYYYRSGKSIEFKEYKKIIEKLPRKDGDFYEFMIRSSEIEDNDEDVIFYSKKLISTDPGNLKTRIKLGEYYLKTKKNKEALSEFLEISKRLNTYPKVHFNIARAYINLRQYDLALKSAKEEIKQNPTLPFGHYIAGEIHRLTGDNNKALPYFEKAISKNSKLVPALMGLGFIKYKRNLLEPAREFYKRALKEEPNNPEIHKQLGYIYNASGQASLAAESFETYLRLDPGATDKPEIERYIRALR